MPDLRIRIRARSRAPAPEAGAEGEHLVSLVTRALEAGGAAPVAVVVRPGRTELLELRPLVAQRVRLSPFLAGLTRSDPVDAGLPLVVGVAGRFTVKRGDTAAPVALAFLEWPDCGWWHWQQLLDGSGSPVTEGELRRCAADGDALPRGLGRWWSLGRRTGAQVRYGDPSEVPALEAPASPLVH